MQASILLSRSETVSGTAAKTEPGAGLLSARAATIRPQPMFRIMAEARKLEAAGRRVVHMEIGDTAGLRNDALITALQQQFQNPALGYSPSAGQLDLRRWIADGYSAEKGIPFSTDHVTIAPANALLSQVLSVTTDPGDGVLIPDPGFPTYELAADYNGLTIARYRLYESTGWNPREDEVLALMDGTPRLRVLVINTPSNPLGTALDPRLVERLLEAARQRGIVCIMDETYKNLIYGGERHHPRHPADGRHVAYIYSFSKDAAAPGLRLGCVVADPAIAGRIADFNSMFFSCIPASFQDAMLSYLRQERPYYETIRAIIPERIAMADAILGQCGALTYVRPEAAFYFYVNISRSGMAADDFAMALLHDAGLCVCPGTGFGPAGRDYVRLSIAGNPQDIEDGCRILTAYADTHKRS